MHKTESELISFDNEIEKILKLNYETYNHNKPNIENIAEVESKKMILFFKMFKNSNNLYINIPKTINDNPFIKFYSFIDMYDNVYNTHKDLVKKYNQNIDRNTKIYKFVLLITALVVILLTFYKDKIDE
jgi:ribosomal protein S17E